MFKPCRLIGVPVQCGTHQTGCLMGPDAYRSAGLANAIHELGYDVADHGNIAPTPSGPKTSVNPAVHGLEDTVGWANVLEKAAFDAMQGGEFPIFLGGDHSLSIGSVPGVTRHAHENHRPQFVLWLDAHPDIHTLESTQSGNLHGTPVAYFSGLSGFEGFYPDLRHAVDPQNICMLGLRSVDKAEKAHLEAAQIDVHDMRAIDEYGIFAPLNAFLERVKAAKGALHVSLDVDFLDPQIAPAVGTTVPGGATFREAHSVMEVLCDAGLVTSLDLVELNPFLDERGRTARLMVDLCASLLGRKVLDRPTHRF